MHTIYKYVLPVEDTAVIQMPEGARPLAVDEQRGSLVLWAEVEDGRPLVDYTFLVRGTGNPRLGNEGVYLGTVVMSYGLVWHVYALANKAAVRP